MLVISPSGERGLKCAGPSVRLGTGDRDHGMADSPGREWRHQLTFGLCIPYSLTSLWFLLRKHSQGSVAAVVNHLGNSDSTVVRMLGMVFALLIVFSYVTYSLFTQTPSPVAPSAKADVSVHFSDHALALSSVWVQMLSPSLAFILRVQVRHVNCHQAQNWAR